MKKDGIIGIISKESLPVDKTNNNAFSLSPNMRFTIIIYNFTFSLKKQNAKILIFR